LNPGEKGAIPYQLLFASEQLGDSEPHKANPSSSDSILIAEMGLAANAVFRSN